MMEVMEKDRRYRPEGADLQEGANYRSGHRGVNLHNWVRLMIKTVENDHGDLLLLRRSFLRRNKVPLLYDIGRLCGLYPPNMPLLRQSLLGRGIMVPLLHHTDLRHPQNIPLLDRTVGTPLLYNTGCVTPLPYHIGCLYPRNLML
jgi:hypothetical protein